MAPLHHPIRVVARRTGLSTHVIRIWEKRYGAVEPQRTGTNRRLYAEADIERLSLLRVLAHEGHGIGQVARLPLERLRKLAAEAERLGRGAGSGRTRAKSTPGFLEECLVAVKGLNAADLEAVFRRAELEIGIQGLLQRVIAPLVQATGELWRTGSIMAAHEHFATAVIRTFLGNATKTVAAAATGPMILVTTPAGQLSELGALLAGASAANLGWRVTYLGTSLPSAEIAGMARQHQARAVALSLVYPEDDPLLGGELKKLRSLLPVEISLIVGGRASPAYRPILDEIGAVAVEDLAEFCAILDSLRLPAKTVRR
jgi:DNA-binding transcriptional MerR regulator/methylmalonyl-CoA mutase cobalamin-binding subunit